MSPAGPREAAETRDVGAAAPAVATPETVEASPPRRPADADELLPGGPIGSPDDAPSTRRDKAEVAADGPPAKKPRSKAGAKAKADSKAAADGPSKPAKRGKKAEAPAAKGRKARTKSKGGADERG